MTRSTLIRLGLLLGLPAVLLTVATRAQRGDVDWDAVEIDTHHVRGTVHYVSGRGGHVGLSVGDDGVIMVDDQFAPLTDRILAAIRGISNGDIRFLINTHVHGDHVGGNENLGRMGVLIVAQDRVRLRLAETMPPVALPALTYSQDVTIHLNGEDVHIFPVPASHTDGDSVIHFRGSDVMVVGDVFRTVAFPVIDRNNGGSLPGTIETLGIIAGRASPDTLILPGHGVVSTREDVVEFRDMVIDVSGKVAELVEQGMTYEQVAAAGTTAAYEGKWGDPERFLTAVYAELAGEG
ncbi:MAG: MBL fold metallo-hydrolase [Acidobacteria bacterium]|nr:MBL fold metallo-hydrolase [Acidobacteriota bacterium]MYI73952.1 MBL fold metallo-hydrolase [Acidobacteriota bacterium]